MVDGAFRRVVLRILQRVLAGGCRRAAEAEARLGEGRGDVMDESLKAIAEARARADIAASEQGTTADRSGATWQEMRGLVVGVLKGDSPPPLRQVALAAKVSRQSVYQWVADDNTGEQEKS